MVNLKYIGEKELHTRHGNWKKDEAKLVGSHVAAILISTYHGAFEIETKPVPAPKQFPPAKTKAREVKD